MGNLSGWTEGIILISAFVVVLTLVAANWNSIYDQNNVVPLVDNNTQSFINYQTQARAQLQNSEVEIGTVNGITVANSYSILVLGLNAVWAVISGGWIPAIGNMLNLGEAGMALMHALQVAWVLSLVFGILYILWRVPA